MTDATAGIGTATAAQANSSLLAGQQNLGTSYTTFLTLLTTQLKNQDPTSPLDTNQFTQQLVQMTGVQQQLLSNELLQTLVNNSNGGGGVSGAVGLIGKTVSTTSPSATLAGGAANWDYTLGTAAASSSATIKDANGVVVWTGALSDLSAGQHTFSWNGKSLSGVAEPNGDYTLSIAAKTDGGQDVAASVVQTGVVSSVASDANGVELTLQGRGKAPLTSVTSVTNG
jgi:flagellar basal-body rod modification protein FlgD